MKHPGGLWDEKRGLSEEITIHSVRRHTFLLGLSSQTEKTAISPENSPKPIKAWVMLFSLSQNSSSHQTEPEITAITFPSFVSVNLNADQLRQPVLRLGGLKLSCRSAPGPTGHGIYLILLEFISHRNEQSKCCWQFEVLKGVHILSATLPPKVSPATPFSPTFHHCGWAPVSFQCLPYLPVTRFSSPCTLGFPSSSL